MKRGLLFAILVASGCGDEPPPPKPATPPARPAGAAAGVGAKGAPPPAPIDPAKASLLADVRKRGFRPEDFVESDQNRDPFRSFLDETGGQNNATQYTIILDKYSLDELKLVAIVGPPTTGRSGRRRQVGSSRAVQARALFLDPSPVQKGYSVVRGEHVSKNDAKVTRIDSENGKVYFEIKEDLGGGKTRNAERVIELVHPEDQVNQ